MNTESQSATAQQKLETLFGGRLVTVCHEDGREETVRVRQLRIVEYDAAFKLLGDEFAFTAFCCQAEPRGTPLPNVLPMTKDWVNTLLPENYEALQSIAREVNARGFFAFADRRQKSADRERQGMAALMAALPPETLKQAADLMKSTSPTSSLTRRPR